MSELRLPAPLPHQVPVLASDARFLLWRAGRRTGKSRAELIAGTAGRGSQRQHKGMLQGGQIAWFAPDYKQAQAIWREEIRPRFSAVQGADVSEVEKRVAIPGLGSLQLLSAENIDAARGWKLDGVLCDESAYWDLEYGWNAVIRPALADRQGWAMFGSTTNAGLDGNALKRVPSYFNMLCERSERGELGPEWATFHNRTEDNPKIPRAEIQALRAEYPEGSATAAQELDAELGVAGGRFYAFDRETHVIPRNALPETLPPWWEFWGAFDWGYAHWATFGVFTRTKEGAVILLDTAWMRRQQDDELAEGCKRCWADQGLVLAQMVEVYAGHDVRAKPMARGAPGISTQEVFAAHGVYLTLADNDRANGARVVRRLMSQSDASRSQGFYIVDTPGNRRVVQQLESIVPDPNDVNKPLKVDADQDGKGGDDGADMVRYGIATRIPLPTEPQPRKDPWEHGRDATQFLFPTQDEQPVIGGLSHGF